MRSGRTRRRSRCIRSRRRTSCAGSPNQEHELITADNNRGNGEGPMSITATVNEAEQAATARVQSGPRLDRLPISRFHRRIFWLIGAGMFFDGYDLYVGTSVLAAAIASKFAILPQVPLFISWTFIGMTIGSVIAGFLGDKYGRRFTYQFNLVVFGLASFAAAFAPDMDWL